MQTKNNVESSKNSLSKKELDKLAKEIADDAILEAKKDKEVLEFDAMGEQLQELMLQHQKEAPEISFKKTMLDRLNYWRDKVKKQGDKFLAR